MSKAHSVSITTHRVIEMDVDRVEEYIDANHAPDDEQIQILDLDTGKTLFDNI